MEGGSLRGVVNAYCKCDSICSEWHHSNGKPCCTYLNQRQDPQCGTALGIIWADSLRCKSQ
eukprot:324823-Hanusia_phi.AAC.1